VQTKTDLKTAKNHSLQFFSSPVQSFWLLGKGRPIMVTVKALSIKKLDQTGLLNTSLNYNSAIPASKYEYFRKIEI
jgi:hypothetical protein